MIAEFLKNSLLGKIQNELSSPKAKIQLTLEGRGGLGPFMAFLFQMQKKPVLYIGRSDEKTRTAFGDCLLFSQEARLFPQREFFPIPDPIAEGERIGVLEELLSRKPFILFSSLISILAPTQSPEKLKELKISLKPGMTFPFGKLPQTLEEWGYRRSPVVIAKNEFALRGGILDLFPPFSEKPYRLEWYGNAIDTIRIFDPVSQRSIEKLPLLELFPPESTTTNKALLLDYLEKETLVVADSPSFWKEEIAQRADLTFDFTKPLEELFNWIENQPLLSLEVLPDQQALPWPFLPVDNFTHRFRDFLNLLTSPEREKNQVYIYTRQASRLKEILSENHLDFIKVVAKPLSQGFALQIPRLEVYTDQELFGRVAAPSFYRKNIASRPVAVEELKEGDLVVHGRHGIAIFEGLIPLSVDKRVEDYLALSFAGTDKLYVPLEEITQVERYVGPEGRKPSPSKLGGREWKNLKKRAKESAKEIAQDLVTLYADRNQTPGHLYSTDTPWQSELEEAFPFTETPDQKKAILETKQDMESSQPMDRLILGDVGYGKTEVALRAAFKAVMDGKQAAVLVPTTVLAEQHYETFSERLAAFPVHVEMLSRFKSKKEQQAILAGVLSGEIDILIGTHRIFQEDVHFKDLGLLIIDEEQRFGVLHKEALRKLRHNVDTLCLSATPIPRTLYLSLIGVRDISVIETPPEERLPVKTFVLPWNPAVARQAITQELLRNGQVYYLYNRIQTMQSKAKQIQSFAPKARLAMAHGRMKTKELEEIMWEFMKGLYDILLCTTIIENGLDIPRVNTLIVENAERYGLSELYQLRGRVGRADRQAYAYFFTPPEERLTEAAQKRLETIQEFTHLGAGYHIAMRDLEIRGSGTLLGFLQSGHVSEIGFHLYCQILADEIKKLKGEKLPSRTPKIQLSLPVKAYIPDGYIPHRPQKLDFYRKLSKARTSREVADLLDEMLDRFGNPPEEVLNLFEMVQLKLTCLKRRIGEINFQENEIRVYFWDGRKTLTFPYEGSFSAKTFDLLQSKLSGLPTNGFDSPAEEN